MELKSVKTQFISLLHDTMTPTNEEKIIVKSKDGIVKHTLEIVKANDIKGQLECIVMKANFVDTDGDWYSNETVDEAQAWHMNNIINKGKNEPSDENHNFEISKGVKLKESWVDKSTDNWQWKVIIDISENEELMQKAKNNELTGVSLAGQAIKKGTEKGTFEKAFDKIAGFFAMKGTKESFDKNKESFQLWDAWNAFIENVSVYDATKDKYVIIDKAEYLQEVKELTSLLKSFKFENINKGVDMTKEEIQALTDEELKEMGLMKIVEEPEDETTEKGQETSKEPEKETSKEPETLTKAEVEELIKGIQKDFDTKLEEVKKARVSGTQEIDTIDDSELSDQEYKDKKLKEMNKR